MPIEVLIVEAQNVIAPSLAVDVGEIGYPPARDGKGEVVPVSKGAITFLRLGPFRWLPIEQVGHQVRPAAVSQPEVGVSIDVGDMVWSGQHPVRQLFAPDSEEFTVMLDDPTGERRIQKASLPEEGHRLIDRPRAVFVAGESIVVAHPPARDAIEEEVEVKVEDSHAVGRLESRSAGQALTPPSDGHETGRSVTIESAGHGMECIEPQILRTGAAAGWK